MLFLDRTLRTRFRAMGWYLARARAMSAPEIVYRGRTRLRSERHRNEAGSWPPRDGVLPPELQRGNGWPLRAALDEHRQRPGVWQSMGEVDPADWLVHERPNAVRATLAAADEVFSGRLRL